MKAKPSATWTSQPTTMWSARSWAATLDGGFTGVNLGAVQKAP